MAILGLDKCGEKGGPKLEVYMRSNFLHFSESICTLFRNECQNIGVYEYAENCLDKAALKFVENKLVAFSV